MAIVLNGVLVNFSGEHHSAGHQVCVYTNTLVPLQRKPEYRSNNGSSVLTNKLLNLDNWYNGCREASAQVQSHGILILL